MLIIRTGSMRGLELCALFVVSTYISRVINENVHKMAKTKTLNFKFMRQMIYHLVGHEILNIVVFFIFHFNVYFSRKWRKCSQNLEKWKFNTYLRVKRYIYHLIYRYFIYRQIYHFVGYEILNKTLYFIKRYYSQILRYLRKCMKKFNIIE